MGLDAQYLIKLTERNGDSNAKTVAVSWKAYGIHKLLFGWMG